MHSLTFTCDGRRTRVLFDSYNDAYAYFDLNREVMFNAVIREFIEGCERCARDDASDVPHNNCMYSGVSIGHSVAHCTADACF